jgi:adenylate kinase
MKIKNLLILIGPPGSGKGTQGKLLAPVLGYNYLSMGATLREFAKGKDEKAKEVKRIIDRGHIIPDEMIRKIFNDTVKELPQAKGLILDGFPRDINQVGILDEAVTRHKIDKIRAVFIDVPKAAVLKRLARRKGIESRADDNPEVIETRFQEYDHKTHPLIDYFEKSHKLTRVHGDQSVEKVHAEIIRKLNHGQTRL